jgi:ribosomal protein S18 acetylase RimI-like enzyme
MTLIDDTPAGTWAVAPAGPQDHSPIADFLATTPGLAGRKFAADSRDVAEQLDGAYPGATTVVHDAAGRVRGYATLHGPHGVEPELIADFVFAPDVPSPVVDGVVATIVDRFRREAPAVPGAYLRSFLGTDQQAAVDALTRLGARVEARFIRTRKPLDGEDEAALAAAALDGITVLGWADVIARGLGEEVRQLQFDTFAEHFGNMSKTPELWEHHLHSRLFAPDFSLAAVDDTGAVVGYVLGSTYTYLGGAGTEERSAHTDYIGVRRDQRRHGLGELLLRKVWLAALRRGLTLASLGTDINNRSKAHLLYERLGYVAVERSAAYRIDV